MNHINRYMNKITMFMSHAYSVEYHWTSTIDVLWKRILKKSNSILYFYGMISSKLNLILLPLINYFVIYFTITLIKWNNQVLGIISDYLYFVFLSTGPPSANCTYFSLPCPYCKYKYHFVYYICTFFGFHCKLMVFEFVYTGEDCYRSAHCGIEANIKWFCNSPIAYSSFVIHTDDGVWGTGVSW